MCLRPVTILNPKIKSGSFLKSVDKEYITVPCGHCSECEQHRVNEYVVRCYYEWLDVVAAGGFSLFDTLTYSEENVPMYNGFRYFSRNDIQLFVKRLKRKIEYDGYEVYGNLKYLIVTEYGSTTFRPHCHVDWFVKIPNMTPEVFNYYVECAWKNVDTQASLGFNDNRNVQDRVINSIYAIRYVTKYIMKDDSVIDCIKFHRDTEISRYFFNYCLVNNKSIDNLPYSELRQVFLSYKQTHEVPKDFELFNFHMLSHGLGMYFLEQAELDDLFNDIIIYDSSRYQYKQYNVPSYYLRKVFYNYDKHNKVFTPNELHHLLKEHQDKQMLNSLQENHITIDGIYASLSLKSRQKICEKYKCEDSPEGYRKLMNEWLNGRSVDHFAKYVIYLRNLHISPYHEWLYDDELDTLSNEFCELISEYRNDALRSAKLPYRTDLFMNTHPEVLVTDDYSSNKLFNQLKQFENYDIMYSFIRDVLDCRKRALNIEYQKRKNEIEKQHAALKKRLSRRILFN